jgi:hypothetical protein
MKANMRNILILPAAMLLSSVVACSSDDSYNDKIFYSSIVTVESVDDDGDATFTFQRYDDSPMLTLTAQNTTVSKARVGKRVLLYYYPKSGEPYESGAVDVRSLSAINCDTAIIRPIERYNWDANGVYLYSMWRSGNYLNMRMRVDYSETARYFGLVVDSLTLNDAVPEVYLLHNLNGAPDNYLREAYASFDISKVWGLPTCKGLRVHVNDTNLQKDIYEFSKSSVN